MSNVPDGSHNQASFFNPKTFACRNDLIDQSAHLLPSLPGPCPSKTECAKLSIDHIVSQNLRRPARWYRDVKLSSRQSRVRCLFIALPSSDLDTSKTWAMRQAAPYRYKAQLTVIFHNALLVITTRVLSCFYSWRLYLVFESVWFPLGHWQCCACKTNLVTA